MCGVAAPFAGSISEVCAQKGAGFWFSKSLRYEFEVYPSTIEDRLTRGTLLVLPSFLQKAFQGLRLFVCGRVGCGV